VHPRERRWRREPKTEGTVTGDRQGPTFLLNLTSQHVKSGTGFGARIRLGVLLGQILGVLVSAFRPAWIVRIAGSRSYGASRPCRLTNAEPDKGFIDCAHSVSTFIRSPCRLAGALDGDTHLITGGLRDSR
jgi:hypothetical protein